MCTHILSSRIFYGVPLGAHDRMCNLQFADNLLLIMIVGADNLIIFKIILLLFKGLSKLAMSFQKSCLCFTSMDINPEETEAAMMNYLVVFFWLLI